jgi:hypothetical protein
MNEISRATSLVLAEFRTASELQHTDMRHGYQQMVGYPFLPVAANDPLPTSEAKDNKISLPSDRCSILATPGCSNFFLHGTEELRHTTGVSDTSRLRRVKDDF